MLRIATALRVVVPGALALTAWVQSLPLGSHPGEPDDSGTFSNGASPDAPKKNQLPFVLPWNASNYNSEHLSETSGIGGPAGNAFGAAAIVMWRLDTAAGVIRVAMATTQSFVALGLNPSTPSMAGADIVACHQSCDGVAVRDYFATGYGTPAEDQVNDWTVVAGGYGGSSQLGVWCEITRPLETCLSVEDFQVIDAGASVSALMSFGTQPGEAALHYHGPNRRFKSFVFDEAALAAEHLAAETGSGAQELYQHVITSPLSVVPDDSTGAEICSYHVLPPELRGAKQHVIDVALEQTVTAARDEELTHHTILYGCPKLVNQFTDGAVVDCAAMWQFCGTDWLGGRLIRSNEGVPVGENLVVATVLLRHYYNPKLLPGREDQNRWTITYTPQLRPFEPVEIQFQTTYLDIPPGQRSVTSVYMPAECTQRIGEVTIEAIRHHMHDYGVAGRLRHIRGDQELAPMHEMNSYTRGVSEGWVPVNRKLLPGDMLIYECHYENTLDQPLIWGERREDEMCVIALKTKGTQINTAKSFVPSAGSQNTRTDAYVFHCSAPNYMNLSHGPIVIPKATFETKINSIKPFVAPSCDSVGTKGQQISRAVPARCPPGFRMPQTAEECQSANPRAAMQDCTGWGDKGKSPGPLCFSRTDMDIYCWDSRGFNETAWGSTLLWCISETGATPGNQEEPCPSLSPTEGPGSENPSGAVETGLPSQAKFSTTSTNVTTSEAGPRDGAPKSAGAQPFGVQLILAISASLATAVAAC